ncbi:MAG: transglutaminase domain-containing protein, partial [Clostridiales bacterium]|nr:transglutaminase domain-containing protein [Clostridiales bacterium]
LKNRRSVCQGYASLVAAMLRAVDIPAKVISGYALGVSADSGWSDSVILSETTNHAWNEAFIDNRWVIIDATWDSGNKWENGTKTESTGMLFRKYFDPTLVAFSVDHKIKDYDETKITNSNINSPQSSTDDSTAVATPSRNAVYVDGQRVSIGAYNINGNNFFKLRDLAYVLKDTEKKFSVIYNSRTNTIILSSGEDYTIVGGETGAVSKVDKEAVISSASVKLNGEKAKISGYTIDGNNYFKLRDIGQAFDFNVSFSNNTVIIDTTSNYQP